MSKLQGPLQKLGRGASRIGYKSLCGRFVYKVPRDTIGINHNHIEAEISRHWGRKTGEGGRAAARCRMIPGTDILVMEYVERLGYDSVPPWATLIDCYQVGRTRDGRIAAWDYSWENDVLVFANRHLPESKTTKTTKTTKKAA